MEQITESFLAFIDAYGYFAVAVLMALENACIPIPSELILGFSGFLVFAERMTFSGALTAGMIGGMVGSIMVYAIGRRGGRKFFDKYGKYFLMKKSHVDFAQRWFDKYGIRAVFFSRLLPVVRTFISLPAGFARVNFKAFIFYTFAGSLPWTAFILYCGVVFGEGWKQLLEMGHTASIIFIAVLAAILAITYFLHKRR